MSINQMSDFNEQQKLMILQSYVSYAKTGNGGLGKQWMFGLIAQKLNNFEYNPYHEDWDLFLSTLELTKNIEFENLIESVAEDFLQKNN